MTVGFVFAAVEGDAPDRANAECEIGIAVAERRVVFELLRHDAARFMVAAGIDDGNFTVCGAAGDFEEIDETIPEE